ncbi:Uncharacterised protein [Salmonella enterica subsp. enterica serovar Bovismorbificans]|uniref:Uncharacterized protein n=1 Tax=Salmonella enterica subsp. enterica serovar Bovismorbificans TaxID=58097 RepID=A0A655CC23_SALET|nr:Uncharacterised protein [Salmonella enterica subsp. enterica serovar Bovismorbificans]
MHQFDVVVSVVTVNGQFQRLDTAAASRYQRYDRATQTRGQSVDINTNLLFFGDIQHVERDNTGNTQLQQLQRQIEVALQIGGVHNVYQQVGVAAQDVVAGDLFVERGL